MHGQSEKGNNSFRIENAGLVLLHPFLVPLFNKLELLHDKIFKSENDTFRAVQILEYIVWGHEGNNSNLYLNKVLCSIPYSESTERSVILSKEETNECDELLKSTITHWSNLRNISLDGFRNSFLQRRGELRMGDQLFLKIENLSIDILLDSLPWNISMIKLPWMESALQTEWRL